MTQATRTVLQGRSATRSSVNRGLARLLGVKLGILRQHEPRPLRFGTEYTKTTAQSPPITLSIVTPCYNQGHFLERTIRSVVDQCYPHLEYIVQDGGSGDATVSILQHYRDRLHHWESAAD